jgi:hypothetical protein
MKAELDAVNQTLAEVRVRHGEAWAGDRLRMLAEQPCLREHLAEFSYEGFCSHCWASEHIDGCPTQEESTDG